MRGPARILFLCPHRRHAVPGKGVRHDHDDVPGGGEARCLRAKLRTHGLLTSAFKSEAKQDGETEQPRRSEREAVQGVENHSLAPAYQQQQCQQIDQFEQGHQIVRTHKKITRSRQLAGRVWKECQDEKRHRSQAAAFSDPSAKTRQECQQEQPSTCQ